MPSEEQRNELIDRYVEARDALAKDSQDRNPRNPFFIPMERYTYKHHCRNGYVLLPPELQGWVDSGKRLHFVRFPDRDSCFLYAEGKGMNVAAVVDGEQLDAYFEREAIDA